MKKKSYLVAALLALGSFVQYSQAQIMDNVFPEWSEQYELETVLDLFKEASGQPLTQDQLDQLPDYQFKQSHIALKDVILNKEGQFNPELEPLRGVFFNCPIGSTGRYSGFPSNNFRDDAYTMWPYTKIHGNWSTGWFGASGGFLDTAHKHGTAGISGLVFWDTTGGGSAAPGVAFRTLVTQKDENGKFIYTDALLDALAFFGQDGVNFNDEAHIYNSDLGEFFEDLTTRAEERNQRFYIGWYGNPAFNSGNTTAYFGPSGKRIATAYMQNYGSCARSSITQREAEALVTAGRIQEKDIYDIYAGKWIVGLGAPDGYTTFEGIENATKVGIAPWGEHGENRIWRHTMGKSLKQFSEEYQRRLEMFYSGGNRNLAASNSNLKLVPTTNGISSETLEEFIGLGTYCPERSSVIGELPFGTNFCIGNGDGFYNCGEKLHANWYNLAAQDIQPTYRWLVRETNKKTASTDIQPSFTFDDAWIGGSALKLSGKAVATGTDIHLYRSDLTVGNGAKAKVTFKIKNAGIGDASNLYLILKKDNADTWNEFSLGNVTLNTYNGWSTATVNLDGYAATDKIMAIGVRVKGNDSDYEALIGELLVDNSAASSVADPIEFFVEVKEETTTNLSLKLTWKMEAPARSQSPIVYNEDVNVDHFEIFLKRGDYRKKMIMKTTQWAALMFALNSEQEEMLKVGVRAVSTDLKSKSNIVWVDVEKDDYAQPGSVLDRYCKAAASITPANDFQKALEQRWLKELKTEGAVRNINVTRTQGLNADSKNYIHYTEESGNSIEVEAGSTFTLSWIANGFTEIGQTDRPDYAADALQMCVAYVYADWNKNYEFNPDDSEGNEANLWYGDGGETWQGADYNPSLIKTTPDGERVVTFGRARKGYDAAERYEILNKSFEIKVPEDARPGKSRLRIVFDDAWFAHVGACSEVVTKGHIIDIDLRVSGEDPDEGGELEGEDVIVGDADLQSDSYTPADGSIVVGINKDKADKAGISSFYPAVADKDITVVNAEKVLIYNLQGILVRSVKGNISTVNVSDLTKGTYIVKMYWNNVIRNGKLIKK